MHTVKLSRVNGRQYAFLSINPGDVGARLLRNGSVRYLREGDIKYGSFALE